MVEVRQALSEISGTIGRYRILCELGQGSMATLYLARMSGTGRFERLFAIKVTHSHLSKEPQFVEMFANEARIAAKIQHPNVVPVYEIDVEAGRYYMVMDYVSGETVAMLLQNTWNRQRPLPFAHSAFVIASACEGLHAAHELKGGDGPLGVVHRDVAPQNLMVGYDGVVRVMDFGIAKARDSVALTKPGMMKGTVAYMAPEQVRCEPIDRRVDTFALGTLLWESTVGMRLFRHHNDVNTAARVLKMEVPRPSTLRSDYPPELEAIVMKALSRDKEARFQTARELGEALATFAHGSGERVTPAVMSAFMREVFPERREERIKMERSAREEDPQPLAPTADETSDPGALALVNAEAAIDVDDLTELAEEEAPNVGFESTAIPLPSSSPSTPVEQEAPVKPKPTATLEIADTVRIDPKLQRSIPTMIVRERVTTPRPEVDVEPTEEDPRPEGLVVPVADAEAPAIVEATRRVEVDLDEMAKMASPSRRPLYLALAVGAAVLLVAILVTRGTEPSGPVVTQPIELKAEAPARVEPPPPEEPEPIVLDAPDPVEADTPEPPPVAAEATDVVPEATVEAAPPAEEKVVRKRRRKKRRRRVKPEAPVATKRKRPPAQEALPPKPKPKPKPEKKQLLFGGDDL